VDFFRNLAVMQKSGISAFEAMEVMASEDSSKPIRAFSNDILESLRCGSSLSESFERRSDVIPESVRYLTQIGEGSGTLDRTLSDAAEHLRRLGKIVDGAKRALIYPVFVFMTIMLTVVFWVSYVIPNIADLFSQMQVQLPALTLWVQSASERLNQYGWEAIAVLMFLMIGIYHRVS
jgi:type II secretory pathway component PulF